MNITKDVYFKIVFRLDEQIQRFFKLMKGKALRKQSLHEKTAASVLLNLFISGNECVYIVIRFNMSFCVIISL